MSHAVEPPKTVQGNHITANIIREEVWRPPNLENDWRIFCITGREGSGKSGTLLSILKAVDPSFTADRVFFKPQNFVQFIEEMPEEERAGTAVAIDEAGVKMGNRTWYEDGQIQLNKMLQTARDDNMIIGMTLPRLEELDIQTQGRLHAYIETRSMSRGDHVRFKWHFWSPTRDGRNKIYKNSPRDDVSGRNVKYRTLAMGPPPEGLFESYNVKKRAFKAELYGDTSESLNDDDEEEELGPKDIAAEIKEQGLPDSFIAVHGGNGRKYIDGDMIQLEYDCSVRDAKKAKKLLERDDEVSVE